MKILYCIPSLSNPGGMERVITEKVNYLAALSGFEIFIVTTDQMGRDVRFSLHDSVTLIHLDLDFDGHFNTPLFKKIVLHKHKIKEYAVKLQELINEQKIDVCISLGGKEIEFLSRLEVKPLKVVELHFAMNFKEQFITSRKSGILWKMIGRLRTFQFKKSLKAVDKLVVLTKNDKQQWEKTHSNITQIYNPNPFIVDETANLQSRRVIAVGRLDAQKGFDMLIEAWKLVYDKHSDWCLDIYGKGEWEKKLKTRIEELKLSSAIKLCGVTPDVRSKYLESSVYVMSSRYEGFGMVLVEAMSCGLPVVSFDCEFGPSEIVTDGVDGYLVEPNNIEELANKICMLIENEEKRKLMGQQAIVNVRRFDIEIVMQQWLNLFDSLIKS